MGEMDGNERGDLMDLMENLKDKGLTPTHEKSGPTHKPKIFFGCFQILKSITRPILVYSTVQKDAYSLDSQRLDGKTTLVSFFVLDLVLDPDERNSVVGSLPHCTVNMRRTSVQAVFAYTYNNSLWRPHMAS